MTEAEYKADCQGKLSTKASEIYKILGDQHTKWHDDLYNAIDAAIARNKEVFTKFFQPLIEWVPRKL